MATKKKRLAGRAVKKRAGRKRVAAKRQRQKGDLLPRGGALQAPRRS